MQDILYKCDPDKNSECTKEECFKNGGDCRCTLTEEFAKVDTNGKRVIDVIIDTDIPNN